MNSGALALLNTAGLIIVAVITFFGNRQLHSLVNSRMTELLELTRRSSKAEGQIQGAEIERASIVAATMPGTPEQSVLTKMDQPIPVADNRTATATERTAAASERVADAAERAADKG